MPTDTTGERIRLALRRAGWNQAKLAKSLGISATSVSEIIRGDWPASDRLREISTLLDVPFEWLTVGDNQPAWVDNEIQAHGVARSHGTAHAGVIRRAPVKPSIFDRAMFGLADLIIAGVNPIVRFSEPMRSGLVHQSLANQRVKVAGGVGKSASGFAMWNHVDADLVVEIRYGLHIGHIRIIAVHDASGGDSVGQTGYVAISDKTDPSWIKMNERGDWVAYMLKTGDDSGLAKLDAPPTGELILQRGDGRKVVAARDDVIMRRVYATVDASKVERASATIPIEGIVSAGPGHIAEWRGSGGSLTIPPHWSAVRVMGDSAYPAIYSGQLALVDESRGIDIRELDEDTGWDLDDDVVLVRLANDRALLKRFCFHPPRDFVLASVNGGRRSPLIRREDILHIVPVVAVIWNDPGEDRESRRKTKQAARASEELGR
jgi:transcriptional regulator with XRE-family HTH domain